MARRRRKKSSSPAEAVIPLVMLGVLYIGFRYGPSGLAKLTNLLLVIGVLSIFGVAGFLIWKNRSKSNVELPTSPKSNTSRAVSKYVTVNPPPDIYDQMRGEKYEKSMSTEKPTEWSLELIRQLEWKRFEESCAGFWKAKGYPAKLTGPGADGGVDVAIQERVDPSKVFAIIQCKAWGNKQVGVEAVRALWGAKDHFQAKMAIFYGLSGFSNDAVNWAVEKHLKLISGEELLEQLKSLNADQQKVLLLQVTRGDYTTPTCAACDMKMIRRVSKGNKSDFWGCKNFPRCRQTINVLKDASPA